VRYIQSKTQLQLEADQPPAENKKFRRIRRRCQTNQTRKPPPNIEAYKIPHLQSQFPPNPTPTQPERSTPATYKFTDPIDIAPNLT